MSINSGITPTDCTRNEWQRHGVGNLRVTENPTLPPSSSRVELVVGLAICLLLSPSVKAEARSRLAPADEYFGRAKLSPIEITNRIGNAERRGSGYGALMTTQAAIEDWTRKYPSDLWIPPREYRMSHLFARLHSRDGNAEAAWCRAYLRVHFPQTRYAALAEREGSAKVAIKKKHHFLGL